jgi:hypothetical protein
MQILARNKPKLTPKVHPSEAFQINCYLIIEDGHPLGNKKMQPHLLRLKFVGIFIFKHCVP